MRLIITIILGMVLLVLSRVAMSDEVTVDLLESKIASMERLVVSMEGGESEWEVRSAMQKHALLMAESVEIIEHLFSSKPERTIQRNQNGSLDMEADEELDEIANSELQVSKLSTLLRHIVIRQNIMMERMGLFK